MIKFNTGDLVHIPAGAYRIRFRKDDEDGQMTIPWDCNLSMHPLIGVFKEQVNERESIVVFFDGEWVIETKSIYLKNKGDRYDTISEYNKNWGNLVS